MLQTKSQRLFPFHIDVLHVNIVISMQIPVLCFRGITVIRLSNTIHLQY